MLDGDHCFGQDTVDDRNNCMDIKIFSRQILFTVKILILWTLSFESVYQPVCLDIIMIDRSCWISFINFFFSTCSIYQRLEVKKRITPLPKNKTTQKTWYENTYIFQGGFMHVHPPYHRIFIVHERRGGFYFALWNDKWCSLIMRDI